MSRLCGGTTRFNLWNLTNPTPTSDLPTDTPAALPDIQPEASSGPALPREIGGPKGPEPTRYGDWEKNGRCIDF